MRNNLWKKIVTGIIFILCTTLGITISSSAVMEYSIRETNDSTPYLFFSRSDGTLSEISTVSSAGSGIEGKSITLDFIDNESVNDISIDFSYLMLGENNQKSEIYTVNSIDHISSKSIPANTEKIVFSGNIDPSDDILQSDMGPYYTQKIYSKTGNIYFMKFKLSQEKENVFRFSLDDIYYYPEKNNINHVTGLPYLDGNSLQTIYLFYDDITNIYSGWNSDASEVINNSSIDCVFDINALPEFQEHIEIDFSNTTCDTGLDYTLQNESISNTTENYFSNQNDSISDKAYVCGVIDYTDKSLLDGYPITIYIKDKQQNNDHIITLVIYLEDYKNDNLIIKLDTKYSGDITVVSYNSDFSTFQTKAFGSYGTESLVPVPQIQEYYGYTLEGWYKEKDFINKWNFDTDKASENITLYAKWIPNKYTIIYDANDGQGTMPDETRVYDDNKPLATNTFTYLGKEFIDWNTNANGNGNSFLPESTNNITYENNKTITLYAQWKTKKSKVVGKVSGNGIVDFQNSNAYYGDTVNISATPLEGSIFKEWKVLSGNVVIDNEKNSSTFFTMGENEVIIEAIFEKSKETFSKTDKNTSFCTGLISDPSSGGYKSYVWFGAYKDSPLKYRVLSQKTDEFGDSTIFLDCDQILEKSSFNNSFNTEWTDSIMSQYLNGNGFLYSDNGFTELERSAIAESTTNKTIPDVDYQVDNRFKEYKNLNGEKIFLLDIEDYSNNVTAYDPLKHYGNVDIKGYWLRTAHNSLPKYLAYVYHKTPALGYGNVGRIDLGISPALNIKRSDIILSSLLSGTSGSDNAAYKLTLYDKDIEIKVPEGKKYTVDNNVFTIPYEITGKNSKNVNNVSVIVLDKPYTVGNTNDAVTLFYSNLDLKDTFSTTGEGTFTLPDTFDLSKWGTDFHMYIIAEDTKDKYSTDYASVPFNFRNITYTVSFNVENGTWNDGTTTNKEVTLSGYEWETLKLSSNQIPAVGDKPADKFKAGSWNITPSTEIEITSDTVYTYSYINKDKKSVKITFKVNDGAWNDGTTADKEVTLSGYEGDILKLSSEQIPAVGNRPADKYKAGSWNIMPNTDVSITSPITYIYTYEKVVEPVNYSNEWIDGLWYNSDGSQTYKYKGGWKQNETGWWYEDESGWYPVDRWQKIDGKWYYFDSVGYMETNQYAGKWDPYSEGNWWVGADGAWDGSEPGVWRLSTNKWYFTDSTGWKAKGKWYRICEKWYLFDKDGWMIEEQD